MAGTGRKQVARAKADDQPTDQRILDAAKRLFRQRGFSGVSVDEIGVASGMTGPAIYRYFKSKEDILVVLFEEAIDVLVSQLGPESDNPYNELRRLARVHAEFIVHDFDLTSLYAQEDRALNGANRRRLLRRQVWYLDRWARTMGRAFPGNDEARLNSMTYAVMGLLNSVVRWPRALAHQDGLVDFLVDATMNCIHGLDVAEPSERDTESAQAS